MAFVLIAKSGYTQGASWLLDDAPLVFGRDGNCDVLLEDGTVSRRAAQLLGISRSTLNLKVRAHGLDAKEV